MEPPVHKFDFDRAEDTVFEELFDFELFSQRSTAHLPLGRSTGRVDASHESHESHERPLNLDERSTDLQPAHSKAQSELIAIFD